MDSSTTDPAPSTHPYQALQPSLILAAVETLGVRCDGRLLALNSYENRVYQVGIEDEAPVVVKFYRPGRWPDAAIREEHAFSFELEERDIPVVPPMRDPEGESLHSHEGFRFAVFARRGGHAPDLEQPDHLAWMGRLLGRIHAVGALRKFEHRPALTAERFGHEPRAWLLDSELIPPELRERFAEVTAMVLDGVEQCFAAAGSPRQLRLHGDCHPGNILWTPDGPHFVDLDDCLSGPAIQDIWMMLSGDREQMSVQVGHLLEGYRQFHDFDARELHLIEALRSLRIIHYNGWLGRRWDDPAFPHSFPWFGDNRYWEDQILSMMEQRAAMDEPALEIPW